MSDDPMRGLFGEAPEHFGFDYGLGGVAAYLPGQESAFNRGILTGIIDSTIQQGLQGLPTAADALAGDTPNAEAEYLLENISVEDGIQQNEINAVVELINRGLVTAEDVSKRTGIPAAEIQATYDALSAQDIAETLSTSEDTAAGLIGLTVGDNEMFVADEETTAAAQAASQAAADAAADDSSSLDSTVAVDTDLTGSTEQTAAELEEETESSGGYTAGDVVTDDRIVGDYPFVYDADANVFHYTPFDANGNRIYTGETLDASTVAGFDPSSEDTGATKSIMFDWETGQASIEQVGDGSTVTDETDDTGATGSGLNITITGGSLVDAVINSKIYGPFQTQAESDAAAAANAATTGSTVTTNGDDASDNNGAGDTNGAGSTNGTGGTNGTNGTNGQDGQDGQDGLDGKDGNDGNDGLDGRDGSDGSDGTDGRDGQDGKDGKDGKDGVIGLFSAIQDSPLTESLLFEPKFTELDNVQLGMFERFLRAAGGRR